jgi:A/G-specific adenine glycosylase
MADYTQAQMDFGATLCTRQNPACMLCVLSGDCVALNQGRVEELPTSRPGKPLPERTALVLLAENAAGEILLQRRPPTGIWASLWSLPEADSHEQARAWFAAHLQGDYDHAEALAEIPHAFTHYRLRIHPLRWRALAARDAVRDNDDLRWVARGDLVSLGLPTPIRKLLG